MDLIPPYLLSTAFGEQYLLLLAQHQRLATGPAPASFSTTSVTPRIEPSSTTATSTSETTTGPLSSAELASAGIEIPASLIPTTPATAAEDFFEAGSFLDQVRFVKKKKNTMTNLFGLPRDPIGHQQWEDFSQTYTFLSLFLSFISSSPFHFFEIV